MQQLYDISIRDGLTGLLNRRGALDTIGKSLTRHQASNAMLLVDIDNLKLINDLRGHDAPPRFLRQTETGLAGSVLFQIPPHLSGGDERTRAWREREPNETAFKGALYDRLFQERGCAS